MPTLVTISAEFMSPAPCLSLLFSSSLPLLGLFQISVKCFSLSSPSDRKPSHTHEMRSVTLELHPINPLPPHQQTLSGQPASQQTTAEETVDRPTENDRDPSPQISFALEDAQSSTDGWVVIKNTQYLAVCRTPSHRASQPGTEDKRWWCPSPAASQHICTKDSNTRDAIRRDREREGGERARGDNLAIVCVGNKKGSTYFAHLSKKKKKEADRQQTSPGDWMTKTYSLSLSTEPKPD